jgi:hypothetical protein
MTAFAVKIVESEVSTLNTPYGEHTYLEIAFQTNDVSDGGTKA